MGIDTFSIKVTSDKVTFRAVWGQKIVSQFSRKFCRRSNSLTNRPLHDPLLQGLFFLILWTQDISRQEHDPYSYLVPICCKSGAPFQSGRGRRRRSVCTQQLAQGNHSLPLQRTHNDPGELVCTETGILIARPSGFWIHSSSPNNVLRQPDLTYDK